VYVQRQCPGVHGSFLFLQKSAAILDAVPVNEFFGTKFLFFFMHAPVIHFPVSFGVRLCAAGVREHPWRTVEPQKDKNHR
jgi:hypothetical protein